MAIICYKDSPFKIAGKRPRYMATGAQAQTTTESGPHTVEHRTQQTLSHRKQSSQATDLWRSTQGVNLSAWRVVVVLWSNVVVYRPAHRNQRSPGNRPRPATVGRRRVRPRYSLPRCYLPQGRGFLLLVTCRRGGGRRWLALAVPCSDGHRIRRGSRVDDMFYLPEG